MSLNFFNVVDALQVWDNVKDSVKASIAVTKNRDTRDLDYSFITPTLLGNETVAMLSKTNLGKIVIIEFALFNRDIMLVNRMLIL
jgi:hypothetical protein